MKALIQLKKVGRFACAVIKKCRYWPAFVPGEAISREFDNLELKVGKSLAISGKLDGEVSLPWLRALGGLLTDHTKSIWHHLPKL